MLYPTRVVIEDNQRAAQVQLINNGTESATYRLTLVNRRMSETGEFLEIKDPLPGEQFADHMLHFSPRQVTLPAGGSQTVRIIVRKPGDLAKGEYRSHLLVAQQPDARAGEVSDEPEKGIGVNITTLIGASIPVIVRHGKLDASVVLANIEVQPSPTHKPILALQLKRSGSRSVYGNLAVGFTPRGGKEKVVARANGVAVYTPNGVRKARLVLDQWDDMMLTSGTLRVTFEEPAETEGKVLAEAVLQVN